MLLGNSVKSTKAVLWYTALKLHKNNLMSFCPLPKLFVANSRRSGQGKAALSTGLWALNGRWRPGAHISESVAAHFQTDVSFINKLHIWSLNNYILI